MYLTFVSSTPLLSSKKQYLQFSKYTTNTIKTSCASIHSKPHQQPSIPKRPRPSSRRAFLKFLIAAPLIPTIAKASSIIDYELDTNTDLSITSEHERAFKELHEESERFGFEETPGEPFTAATAEDYYNASRIHSDLVPPKVLVARAGVLGFVAAFTATAMAISERESLRIRLPSEYEPSTIARYFLIRPDKVVRRVALFARETLAVSLAWLPHLVLSRVDTYAVKRRTKTAEWAAQRAQIRVEKAAAASRDAITRLGPAVIKLGQAAAARPDLLGATIIRELQKLQDDILAFFPTTDAYELIYEELGAWPLTLFDDISERPIAGASLGMVFKAKIEGKPVAVKVQRPEVAENIAMDFYIVRIMAKVANLLLRSRTDFQLAVDEYASRLFEELDYSNELQNMIKFRQLYGNLPGIYLPKAFPDYCSRKVLVTEWVDGVKLIDDNAKVRKEDIQLVEIGIQFALDQLLDKGFLHADMHNGNMMKTKSGYLAYIDFGLVAEVPQEVRESLVCALMHLIHGEYNKLAETFVGLALMRSDDIDVDLPILAEALKDVLEPRNPADGMNPLMGVDRFDHFTLVGIVGKLVLLGTRFPFVFNDYFLNNLRCLGILEGLALNADPDFNILNVVYPYVVKKMLTDPSPRYKRSLETLLTDSYGRVRWSRLEQLLQEVQMAAAITALGPLRGGKALGIKTPTMTPEEADRQRARTSFLDNGILKQGSKQVQGQHSPDLVLQFMLSPSGRFLRQHIIRQVMVGLDDSNRSRIDSLLGHSPQTESIITTSAVPDELIGVVPSGDADALHRAAMRATPRELSDDQARVRASELLSGTSPFKRLAAMVRLAPLFILPFVRTMLGIVMYFLSGLTKKAKGWRTPVNAVVDAGAAAAAATSVAVGTSNSAISRTESFSGSKNGIDRWSIAEDLDQQVLEEEWRPFDSSFLRRTRAAREQSIQVPNPNPVTFE